MVARASTICMPAKWATPPTRSSARSTRARRRRRSRWCSRPRTACRSPSFPIPAYDKVPFGRYLLGTVQFSSGCPYLCEFCDIPGLYGRQPRMKTPQQIVAELDFIFSQPNPPTTLYFVDDNFIGNRKAAKEMLPHLVEWQKKHPLSGDVRLRGDAQHLQADRHSGTDEGGELRRHVRRHRDARGRRARRHAQGPQQRGPDDGVDQDAQQLRDRDHVRHHSRPRFRNAPIPSSG